MRRRLLVGAGAMLVLALAAWIGLEWMRTPSSTPAMRGSQVAARLGCFACHGPGGIRGAPNPGARESVPPWDGGTYMMYVESEADVREWILYGQPRRLAQAEGSGDGALLAMPAYEGRLSEDALSDLVAYYRAVAWYTPGIPPDAAEGRRVASRLGCFACHGPSGQVGMANPGSFKRYIPPWEGDDFADLVEDEDELRAWILDGQIERWRDNPLARHFIDRQQIDMPAYRGHLDGHELDAIVAYIGWLRGSEPE